MDMPSPDTAPVPKWDLRIVPATGQVAKYTCSLFPPGSPKHGDVPSALMATHIDTESHKHAVWGNRFIERFNIVYMVSAIEVCPQTDSLHYQFYFESSNKNLQIATVRKWCYQHFSSETMAISMQRSVATAEANTLYIQNPDKYMYGTYGPACVAGKPYIPTRVGQGTPSGLAELIEGLRQGLVHYTDVAMTHPDIFTRYHKVLAMAEGQYIRRLARSTMCSVIYLWGTTGVGKSHFAYNKFGPAGGYYANPELFYIFNSEDGKWWDDYRGQEYVIFNEYRGQLPLSFFLQLLDKWPVNVPRRHNAPYPFLAKYICITSAVPPRELYTNAFTENDRLAQLTRRIGAGEINVMSRMHMESIPHFPEVDLAGNQPAEAE